MAEGKAAAVSKFTELKRNYARDLPGSIAGLRDAWPGAGTGQPDALATMRRIAHRMVGSGGTFGFPAVSEAAAPLEILLDGLIAGNDPHAASPDIQRQIDTLIAHLAATCQEAEATMTGDGAAAAGTGADDDDAATSNTILVVADSPALAQEIGGQAEAAGFAVETAASSSDLAARVGGERPAAVVVDGLPPATDGGRRAALVGLAGRFGQHSPVIYVSDADALDARLAAVEAGGAAFLRRPLDPALLVDEILRLAHRPDQDPFRVLIVEDEAPLAACYGLILEQAGMDVRVVTDPMQSLEPLSELDPDLMLLDLYMPGCDGFNLAQIVRQQPRYHHMPLLFLSTEANLDRQLKARRLGGDDFLTKPISPIQLVSAVTSRIKRYRTLRGLTERDALTGLLNHTALMVRLVAEVARTRRNGSPLAFAMLDLDQFKDVNDSYGHPAGDQVLAAFAKLLRRQFRRSDIVGRYGGEEFAVVLPETDAATAAEVIDRARSAFASIEHVRPGGCFTVTVSAGAAATDGSDADAAHLVEAADRALYDAKQAGRNRICLAPIRRSSDQAASPADPARMA